MMARQRGRTKEKFSEEYAARVGKTRIGWCCPGCDRAISGTTNGLRSAQRSRPLALDGGGQYHPPSLGCRNHRLEGTPNVCKCRATLHPMTAKLHRSKIGKTVFLLGVTACACFTIGSATAGPAERGISTQLRVVRSLEGKIDLLSDAADESALRLLAGGNVFLAGEKVMVSEFLASKVILVCLKIPMVPPLIVSN